MRLEFQTTNNEAEYEALLVGLDLARSVGASSMVIRCDSYVITRQVNGGYEAKGERMRKYLNLMKQHIGRDSNVRFVQVPREENANANRLAKIASAEGMILDERVLYFIQYAPTTDHIEVKVIPLGDERMVLIISYLKEGQLPDDHVSARKLKIRASRFVLIGDKLYKRSFTLLYLSCLAPDEANYVMREVHEGICGNHARACSLTQKLM